MIKQIFGKFGSWFRGEKRVVLVEIGARGGAAFPFSWDDRGRKIEVERRVEPADGFRRLPSGKIFLRLAPDAGLGMHETFSFSRPNAPLHQSDLERLVSQAVLRFYETGRAEAARRLAVNPAEIIFLNVAVWRVAVDGREVLDPTIAEGSLFEIEIGGTFAHKNLASVFNELGADARDAAASSVPLAYLFSRFNKITEPALFVAVGARETAVFGIGPGRVLLRDSFAWGQDSLTSGIAQDFSVNNEIARELKAVYNHNQQMLGCEYQLFLNGIRIAVGNGALASAHIYARESIPDFVFAERVFDLNGREIRLCPAAIANWSDECGYGLRVTDSSALPHAPEIAAEFIYRQLRPRANLVNVIAERKRRWLSVNFNKNG